MKNFQLAILVLFAIPVFPQTPAQQAAPAPKPDSAAVANAPEIDPTKEADIRQLIQMTAADKLADQMMTGMEANLKPSLMSAFPPGEYRERLVTLFFEKMHSKASLSLVDLVVPVYDKYFSDAEIRELTAFYQTPAGKKAVAVMPQLMTEVMQTSQAWGQQLARDSLQEVLQEHPELKQAMEEAEKKSKSQ